MIAKLRLLPHILLLSILLALAFQVSFVAETMGPMPIPQYGGLDLKVIILFVPTLVIGILSLTAKKGAGAPLVVYWTLGIISTATIMRSSIRVFLPLGGTVSASERFDLVEALLDVAAFAVSIWIHLEALTIGVVSELKARGADDVMAAEAQEVLSHSLRSRIAAGTVAVLGLAIIAALGTGLLAKAQLGSFTLAMLLASVVLAAVGLRAAVAARPK
ncbi:MAG: hypothetical protein HY556_00270 [Euryarchaeota archaeon]|nr:hypothetical protein [Euryarchaeota archaeon]